MRGPRGALIRKLVTTVALILAVLVGAWTASAGDTYSNPSINFPGNVTLDRVAAGFAEDADDHLHNVVYVTARVQGCTNRVYRVSASRNRALFATLPGCTTIDVDVNTDGTSEWPYLSVFISQGNDIWIVPRSGPAAGSGTPLTTTSIEHFTTLTNSDACPGDGILAIGLDELKAHFAGNLVVECTPSGGTMRFQEVTPDETVLPLPSVPVAGTGMFDFAPLNWRQQSGKVLMVDSGGNLKAVSRTGSTTVVNVPALSGVAVRVYAIPGVFLAMFNGEAGAFATSLSNTLQRWTWTLADPADARGGVLLWVGGTGNRVIVYRNADHDPAFASLSHPASGSDGAWSPLALEAKDCNPTAFEKDNTGSKGTVNCVAYTTDGFDAVTDVDWSAPDPLGVYCGVYGGITEARASPKGAGKDVDGDGDIDQPFTFDAKDAPLLAQTPGAVPFCTFHFTNPHGGGM